MKRHCPGKYAVWALVVLLFVLHQDNWLWENDYLVLGFLPIGLLYHVGISVAASITWFLATILAWPAGLAETTASDDGGHGDAGAGA